MSAARQLINSTEELKAWNVRVIAEQRQLRATRNSMFGMLADVTHAQSNMLVRRDFIARDRRFDGAPITGFGGGL